MKISTKGRYALRMLLDMAQHQQEGYVTLKDIAQRQGISKKYLEQIALILGQAGQAVLNVARRQDAVVQLLLQDFVCHARQLGIVNAAA